MITIAREGAHPIVVNAPTDPDLARVWSLVQATAYSRLAPPRRLAG